MAKTSTLLLETTIDQVNATGPAIKAAGYFGSSNGLHTIANYLNDFTGRIIIEGTLANCPKEGDWFAIAISGNPYIQHPIGTPTGINGDTGVESFSFRGNFVFLRARLDRTFLPNPTAPTNGHIEKILLNF